MLKHLPQSEFIEGRWRNGMGMSWEIAALREAGSADFSWRLAKARIDGDVPFSIYPGMDRVFMQLDGQGIDLEFADGLVIEVHESFVPHRFSCDIPLNCKLLHGPCMDLNLFTARDKYRSEFAVTRISGQQGIALHGHSSVFFALDGPCRILADGGRVDLAKGDAAVAQNLSLFHVHAQNSTLFVGQLIPA